MTIRPILKSYYSTEEVELLTKNFLDTIAKSPSEQVIVSALAKELSKSYDAIKEASSNSNHNSKTELVIEADWVRDMAFRAFYNLIETGTLRQNEKHRSSCVKIMEFLDRFDKRLHNYGYTKESIELRKFFDEMDHVKQELKTVQASAWLAELKTAEENFIQIQQEKIVEQAASRVIVLTKDAKNQALDQLINITQTLNGLESVGIDGISELNVQLDSVIADIETPAKARLGRRARQPIVE